MKIQEGTSRLALVGEHTTLKIPHWQTFNRLVGLAKRILRRDIKLIKNWFESPEESFQGLGFTLSGFFQNWREVTNSESLGDIVVPTRLSLFGIINLQSTAKPIPSEIDIWKIMLEATNNEAYQDGHSFCHRSNYGMYRGKIRMLDYGSKKALLILKKYRKEISQALADIEV
jgi:hypothetical protein